MRCLSPRTVGFLADGKTITWSQHKYSKEYATFQLPCSKCIECRLEFARQWAVRCVHESMIHEDNSFITLTYTDENLTTPKLVYPDFQKFVKRLRKHIDEEKPHHSKEEKSISIFVTGEYGEQTKRPHWHALIFNWRPTDTVYKYSNDRGDKIYNSELLSQIWGKGIAEIGQVTFESAGYCARYAAKKLIHGNDESHDYQPISKRSSHHAIGKRFIEKYWQDIFNYGKVTLQNGQSCGIPRYYEKWLQKHQPSAWIQYVTKTKLRKQAHAQAQQEKIAQLEKDLISIRTDRGNYIPYQTNKMARKTIIEEKFNRLQKHLKGDI